MDYNNLSQNELLSESEFSELINEFYNYYGQPQTTGTQERSPSLNINNDNIINCDGDMNLTCDYINEFPPLNDAEYLPFVPQNYQQPMTSNEHFTDFTSTSNHYLPCIPQSIPTQSIPSDNFSYTINTFNSVTVDSLQTNTCEIFKFEYKVITLPASSPITPITPITPATPITPNVLEMQQQLNYFSLTNNLQSQFQQ